MLSTLVNMIWEVEGSVGMGRSRGVAGGAVETGGETEVRDGLELLGGNELPRATLALDI